MKSSEVKFKDKERLFLAKKSSLHLVKNESTSTIYEHGPTSF